MAKAPASENQFDETREKLVVERKTTWPKGLDVTETERQAINDRLHREPAAAKKLEYVRCPTGLIRHITVTPEDVDRILNSHPTST